jgi:N-acetylglucosaminyldiphosphoundecaprenol N-acetyl-beta-D-mannosaminyltransferase
LNTLAIRLAADEPLRGSADRVNILGVGLSPSNIPSALARFERWIETGRREYVCVADVHVVMQARWNPNYRAVLNIAGMITTDGMPLVWLCRLERGADVRRVYGPDLLLAACEHGLKAGRRHFFLGGPPGLGETLAARLQARFPGLQVAGVHSPPFRPTSDAEDREMILKINAARPDYLWIGLGAPKQELWMARFRAALDAPVMLGVGAAFDFHAGVKKQAPAAIRALGAEWLFRLATEPARLWPRYRKVVPGFLYHLALQRSGVARYPLEDAGVFSLR